MRLVGSRKTLGLDADLAEELKDAARKRGLTLSNYMRALIKEALALEKLGYYAPRALKEKRAEYVLENLGFVLVPKEVLHAALRSSKLSDSEVAEIGRRVALVIKEVGVEPIELVELISKPLSTVISEPDKLVLIMPPDTTGQVLAGLIKGLSEGSGLNVEKNESIIVIKIPKEMIAESLSEFKERKTRKLRRPPQGR